MRPVRSTSISLASSDSANAETITQLIAEELKESGLPLEHASGFGSDGAIVSRQEPGMVLVLDYSTSNVSLPCSDTLHKPWIGAGLWR